MGEALFSARAYTPSDVLAVLRALVAVIDDRAPRMAGRTRTHTPTAGDPLHVFVVDELAALTAYADVSIRREADRLLSIILSQGRALGVSVVACVQDPRKEVVSMRGLFTQTVALRLASEFEVSMVLGDGMHDLAPAHRISATTPGVGYVVEDSGAVARVRDDYWTDDTIRHAAGLYATAVHVDLTPYRDENGEDTDATGTSSTTSTGPVDVPPAATGRKPRAPRSPRAPRAPRAPRTPRDEREVA